MATKFGWLEELERVGPFHAQARLHNGQRVDIPVDLLHRIMQTYPRTQLLVFVERRELLFNKVAWVGTVEEAHDAVRSGVLTTRDIERLPSLDLLEEAGLNKAAPTPTEDEATVGPRRVTPTTPGRRCAVCKRPAPFAIGESGLFGMPVCEEHARRYLDGQSTDPDGVKPVRGGGAAGHAPPRTGREARAAIEELGRFCDDCPIRSRCVTEACRVWHETKAASAVIAADIPVALGVPPGEGTRGVPPADLD